MLDESTDTRKAFPPEVHARLSAIRRSVDPHGIFLGAHSSPDTGVGTT
jgi:FAD/FMN-containing dehydrogenase